MSTTTERTPFIAPLVDNAAQFIKERGAVTVSELAEYLSAVGVTVRGDAELTGEELAYFWDRKQFLALPVIASGSAIFLRIVEALLVNRSVHLDATNPALAKLTWDGRRDGLSRGVTVDEGHKPHGRPLSHPHRPRPRRTTADR